MAGPPLFFQFPRLLALRRQHSVSGDLVGATIIIVLGSAFFGVVANLTTGITLTHSRFGNATITFFPNPNVTGTIGFVPIIDLIPFVFGILILLGVYAIFERNLPGGL